MPFPRIQGLYLNVVFLGPGLDGFDGAVGRIDESDEVAKKLKNTNKKF
jgi:hypothetical protein